MGYRSRGSTTHTDDFFVISGGDGGRLHFFRANAVLRDIWTLWLAWLKRESQA